RVDEGEAALHQAFVFPVERRTLQIQQALHVNEDFDAALLKDLVTRTLLGVERQVVAQARTTAALHADPQAAFAQTVVPHELMNPRNRFFSQLKHVHTPLSPRIAWLR